MFGTSAFQNTAPPSNIHIIVLKDAGYQLPNYNLASAGSWVNLWGFREWPCNISDNISCCAFLKFLFGGFFSHPYRVCPFILSISLLPSPSLRASLMNHSLTMKFTKTKNLKFSRDIYIHFILTLYTPSLFTHMIRFVNPSPEYLQGYSICVMAHNR